MDQPIQITTVHDGDLAIVTLVGEVGLAVSNLDYEFTKINAGKPKYVILDMSRVPFVSSLGMGLFVHVKNTLNHCDGRLFAFGLSGKVLDSFHRARLDGLFEVRANLQECLASARGQ